MEPTGGGQALRLDLGRSAGFFDLREVIRSVGEWPALQWILRHAWFNGDVTSVWPEGYEDPEAASDEPGGLVMDWEQMVRLADRCQQIVDGRFTGYDGDGQPVLQFLVFDSSYWVVWSRDAAVLDAVRTSFPHAEPHDRREDEPIPVPF